MSKILPINTSAIFCTSLRVGKKIVRTGTIGEGSCLIHSILRATDKKYNKLTIEEKKQYVKDLRAEFGKITKKDWENISDGLVSVISYQENFLLLLSVFYKIIKTYKQSLIYKNKYINNIITNIIKTPESINRYINITNIIPIEIFEKQILPQSYKNQENKPILYNKLEIINQTLIYYNKSINGKDDYLINNIREMILIISDESENFSYNNYIEKIANRNTFMDTSNIELLCNKFDRDIYFIDGNTRIPYIGIGQQNIKNRKSLIIIWVKKVHYEIAGILLKNNRIQREFDPDDPVIVKIKTFLYNPWVISEKYPDLVKYLPTLYKNI
jgi:hypothetical protein